MSRSSLFCPVVRVDNSGVRIVDLRSDPDRSARPLSKPAGGLWAALVDAQRDDDLDQDPEVPRRRLAALHLQPVWAGSADC